MFACVVCVQPASAQTPTTPPPATGAARSPASPAVNPIPAATALPQQSPPPEKTETPAVIQNTGQPIVVPLDCTDDDIQWAGMSCSEEEPCPIYLEISAVETIGNRIVLLGNLHTLSTTLYSVILSSDDNGATWREPYGRVRGAAIDHIQFVDFQNGWISGQTMVPVARDPFLLITNDGGKSWRLRPIFSEGSGGAIQQFWFDSASTGALVIDHMQNAAESSRYELYETPNGGETWMIRRTSDRPINIKRAALERADSAWRVRADARSKSYAVEKNQNEHWTTIARFLVHVGNCKPAPRILAPEPVETPGVEPTTPSPIPARPPSLKPPPKKK